MPHASTACLTIDWKLSRRLMISYQLSSSYSFYSNNNDNDNNDYHNNNNDNDDNNKNDNNINNNNVNNKGNNWITYRRLSL